jgi:hypothetical protein
MAWEIGKHWQGAGMLRKSLLYFQVNITGSICYDGATWQGSAVLVKNGDRPPGEEKDSTEFAKEQ